MNILVFGLGALGHVFAAFLQRAGHRVIGIGRPKVAEIVRQQGIAVTGIWGEFQIKLTGIYESVGEIEADNFDLILLTVKSYDTQTAVEVLKPIVGKKTILVCAQNGYGNYETAAQVLGEEHVVLARVIFGAELLAPGQVKVTVCADDMKIGSPKGVIPKARLEEIARCLTDAGIRTQVTERIISYLWDKILYNCALNPLGATLEVPYGVLGDTPALRAIMNEIVREIFTIAKAHQVPLFWNTPEDYLNHFYTRLLPPTRNHHPSMLQDIRRGKRTEIDALNGAIVSLGKKAGIATPVNETITKLIKAKEQLCRRERNWF